MNERLRDNIKSRVDKILCLTCPQGIESRLYPLLDEFERRGLSDIVLPFPNVHSVIEHAELDRRWFANEATRKVNVKNCTLGHYHMVKFADDAGYDNVMIVEDDCRFSLTDDILVDYFDELPRNTTAVLCYSGFDRSIHRNLFSSRSLLRWSVIPPGSWFDFTTCYILSRAGIKSLVRYYESAGVKGYPRPVDAPDRCWPTLSGDVPLYMPRFSLFWPSGSPSTINREDV